MKMHCRMKSKSSHMELKRCYEEMDHAEFKSLPSSCFLLHLAVSSCGDRVLELGFIHLSKYQVPKQKHPSVQAQMARCHPPQKKTCHQNGRVTHITGKPLLPFDRRP